MTVRPIDANIAMKKIREYMEDFPNASTRLATCRSILSMLGDENQIPTLTPPNEPPLLEFDVVDTTTGKYPDWERIAREESWAKGLVYCDMDGIAIREDGSLILLDECGNCVSCPPDRFEIRRRPPEGEEDTHEMS